MRTREGMLWQDCRRWEGASKNIRFHSTARRDTVFYGDKHRTKQGVERKEPRIHFPIPST
jgi:hypothetical protein